MEFSASYYPRYCKEQQDKSLRDMTRQTPAFFPHGNCFIFVRLRVLSSVMQQEACVSKFK